MTTSHGIVNTLLVRGGGKVDIQDKQVLSPWQQGVVNITWHKCVMLA